jgi:hypothetical protein
MALLSTVVFAKKSEDYLYASSPIVKNLKKARRKQANNE